MEVVDVFSGIGTERGLYAYFRSHFAEWFPALAEVHCIAFTHQLANLWVLKKAVVASSARADQLRSGDHFL